MMFSVNQVRHFFVLKNKKSTVAELANVGDYFVDLVYPSDGPAIHLVYQGYDSVTHTDLIPLANIRRTNFTPFHKLRTALPAVSVTTTAPMVVAGTEYLLTMRFPEYITLTPEEDMVKTVSFVYSATGGSFGAQLKTAIDLAFARDINQPITVTVDETGLIVTITSNESRWRHGLMENKPNRVIIQSLKAFPTTGASYTWGTIADATDVTVAYMKNGYKTADLEYFCMGFRGDEYRQNGFPNTIDTQYVISNSDAKTKEYDYIDIHYFFQGEGLNNDYSEKVITFVAEAVDGDDYETGDPIFDLEYWLDNTANITDATTSHFSPITLPTPTTLAVPSGTITTTQAVVTWTAGGDETSWDFGYKLASGETWTTSTVSTTATKTITGLTANTKYDVRVRAKATGKTSEYTTAVSFTTDAT